MKAVGLQLCAGFLIAWCSQAGRADDLPQAAREALVAYQNDVNELERNAAGRLKQIGAKAVAQLRVFQDQSCKEAKLDEALAIRDLCRQIQSGASNPSAGSLSSAAREVLAVYVAQAAEVQKAEQGQAKKAREKAAGQLKILQDQFCKEARLDEAALIRDQRRMVLTGVTNVLPDPGYLHAEQADIGKVWYFEVVGNTQGGAWGTDVYTSDSHLATAAVHAGVLRVGQKDILKVTILPGEANYPSTTRNGVTSSGWGQWGVSFKVERLAALGG